MFEINDKVVYGVVGVCVIENIGKPPIKGIDKDYYFLPLEDRAIHKSIGEFMDKKFRKAATASTCYEKFSGSFLPIFDSKSKNFENCFKLEYKDKNQYIKADSINDNTITEYSHIILDYLKNNK